MTNLSSRGSVAKNRVQSFASAAFVNRIKLLQITLCRKLCKQTAIREEAALLCSLSAWQGMRLSFSILSEKIYL
ncbi:MAG: hypothetical protein CVV41_22280 [Candidatus Riflebacteria bacterium HGW-Riflebacteria-1]|nr:MAG: hypothetical protein CVV41_22280 [Candidatus Riflebacteria bacterium HGW-Riflebacteria-1]